MTNLWEIMTNPRLKIRIKKNKDWRKLKMKNTLTMLRMIYLNRWANTVKWKSELQFYSIVTSFCIIIF